MNYKELERILPVGGGITQPWRGRPITGPWPGVRFEFSTVYTPPGGDPVPVSVVFRGVLNNFFCTFNRTDYDRDPDLIRRIDAHVSAGVRWALAPYVKGGSVHITRGSV